ncbi:hypothetical protein AB4356_07735 [Vibrio lentus]
MLAEVQKRENELTATHNGTARFDTVLQTLRIARDSAPEAFDNLNPDEVKKFNDEVYVDAFIVANNENTPL